MCSDVLHYHNLLYIHAADPQSGEDVPPSGEDLECWKGALKEAATDFKALFRACDLDYFRDVLTKKEFEELNALNATGDQLSSAVFERVRVKEHNLLRKIPECLREAGNDSLANELEGA